MTTITPLLLVTERPEGGEPSDPEGHRRLVVPTAVDHDGVTRVDLAPTQVKGMLRAAYEAVTNSRLGVFSAAHDDPLGYRSAARSGSGLRPVVVEHGPDGPAVVIYGLLVPGDAHNVIPAAVLEAWNYDSETRRSPTTALCTLSNGRQVEAIVVLETVRTPKGPLSRWRVEQAASARPGATLLTSPAMPSRCWARVRGYLHITGPTIKNKRFEHLFVTELLDSSPGVVLDPPRT